MNAKNINRNLLNIVAVNIVIIMCLFVLSVPVSAGVGSEPVKKGTLRIYGQDRYETAYTTADALKEQLGKELFDAVVVACGTDFADALAGSYMAAEKDAPILMAGGNEDELCKYISENLNNNGIVYILGGYNAVSESLDQKIENAGFKFKRLSGGDRYGTNIAILKEAGATEEELLVCTAYNFADSLSASAADKPILLVNSKTGKLTELQNEFLNSYKIEKICIIGGENAVSVSFEKSLKRYGVVNRLGGPTRYETSVMVAKYFADSPKSVVLAYSENYPDGLCGGAFAYSMDSALILTKDGNERAAAEYVAEHALNNGTVLGGPVLISDNAVRKIFNLDSAYEIKNWNDVRKYNVNYVLNGGVNVSSNPAEYTEGQTVILSAPEKENYTFKGWYKEKNFRTKVDKITSSEKGDITLYAKWHLKALNINETGLDDMIWSWWYYPQVVSDGDKVFWGYSSNKGYCGVAEYDSKAGSVKKTALKKANEIDDHNGLALVTLKDKRIMCIYAGGHNSNNEIHVRISDNPLDISSFGSDVVLESSGKTCYSQIVESNGRYYLFYRVNNNSWAYRMSEDGEDWSNETIFVKAPMQYYCRIMPTTEDGTLRIIMYSNPAASATEIRMGFLDTESNSICNADGTTKLADSMNSYEAFDVLLYAPEDKTQRMFDVAITDPDKPAFLYTVFTQKSGKNDSVYYLYDSGNSYEICDGGKPLWDPKYQLGSAFVDSNTIVAGRNDKGTDYIEFYSYDGSSVVHKKTLDSQSEEAGRNARPIVDVNGKAVLWHNGYYNLKSYKDFDTAARLYLIDKNKLITGVTDY